MSAQFEKGKGRNGVGGRPIPHGFTLVELLVTISIITILSALVVGVAGRAGDTARQARTKQLITRLHTLVLERYETYRTQRVELDERDNNSNGVANWLENLRAQQQWHGIQSIQPQLEEAAGRLVALRELMKLEMPDRWSDIVGNTLPMIDDDDAPEIQTPLTATQIFPKFLRSNPSLHALYLREYNKIASDSFINSVTGNANTAGDIRENQTAELLYLVVMHATADGEARSLFKETDQGDVDGDGAPEFIDGWGKPIRWLRWAPGFESDLQQSIASLTPPLTNIQIAEQITLDHDPLDMFSVDQPQDSEIVVNGSSNIVTGIRGWRLVPLIYSGGSDEETGLYFGDTYLCVADPYANDINSDSGLQRLGAPFDSETPADNIHNHYISTR